MLNAFPHKIRKKASMFTTLIQQKDENPSHSNKAKNENKMHRDVK